MNCTRCGKWAGAYAGFPKDHDLCVCTKPKKEWVGLTDEEIEELTSVMFEEPSNEEVIDFALRVQAKLKEKNNG
jgi:hypothetical protein